MERNMLFKELEDGNSFASAIQSFSSNALNTISAIKGFIESGIMDENKLTDLVMNMRHPELKTRKLSQNDSFALKHEWKDVRNNLVRPLLKKSKKMTGPQISSDKVLDNVKKQNDLAVALATFGQYKNFKDNVLVWDLNNEGIIFEFEDGKLKYKLSYPNEAGRVYYKEGDIILAGLVLADKLPSYFNNKSTDGDIANDDISYLQILLAFLNDGEQKEYELAYKIIHIYSYGKDSSVVLRPLIKIEGIWVESGTNITKPAYAKTGSLLDDSLSVAFWQARSSKNFHRVAEILTMEAKITKEILSLYGGEVAEIVTKKALRWGAKKTIGAGIKKIIKHYITKLILKIPVILFAGLKAFVFTLVKGLLTFKKEKGSAFQLYGYLASADFKVLIVSASSAMAAAMVEKLFSELIDDKISHFFVGLLNRAGNNSKRLQAIIGGFLTRKIAALFTKDFFNEIVSMIAGAYEGYLQNKGTFENLLVDKMGEKLLNDAGDKFKSWGSEAVEEISKDVIAIFSP